MENASKALIIAGAILLSILLISLGILIFNQAQDTVNNSGMSQAEISAFNNKFLKYEGTQKGSVVKSLINEVIASNSDENNKNAKRTINITSHTDQNLGTIVHSGNSNGNTSVIDISKSYTVKITEYKNGCVSVISIDY